MLTWIGAYRSGVRRPAAVAGPGERAPSPPGAGEGAETDGLGNGGRLWPVVAACGAVAVASLALPSTLTYDSWSWLTWGRELAHLRLDTSGFVAAWKPLPVLAAALFSPAGHLAPVLWLVTARTGGLLAVAEAYRLARRAAGTGPGLVAAAALLLSAGFTGYLLPLGMSEPLLAGLALCAVDRSLEGRHLEALVLVWFAALLRPEVWPFLGIYGIWLWRMEPRRRLLLVALATLLPVLWFGPDLLAAGDAFRSLHRADLPTQGGPLLGPRPGLTLLGTAAHYLPLPFALTAPVPIVALGARALVRRHAHQQRPSGQRRPRVERTTRAMTIVSGVWLIIEVATTQVGRNPGDQRYLIVAGAGAAVLAGIGWGLVVEAGARVGARCAARLDPEGGAGHGPGRLGRAVVSVALVCLTVPFVVVGIRQLRSDGREIRYQAALYRQLPVAVRAAGGVRHVVDCGAVYTSFYQAPAVAWQLDVHLGDVRLTTAPLGAQRAARSPRTRAARELARFMPSVPRPPGTVLDAPSTRTGSPPAPDAPDAGFASEISRGRWRVASSCAQGPGRR